MRAHKTTGIIIKRRNIGEADRILTIFTQDEGKIQIKAKGVRKITSKRAPHIEFLNYCSLTMHKTERMPILTEADTIHSYQQIKTDLSRIGLAYHICELVDSLCPDNQENSQVFTLLTQMLSDLSEKTNIAHAIHKFEVDLLTTLGYAPTGHDLTGSKASFFIESILERKLKSRQILPHLL